MRILKRNREQGLPGKNLATLPERRQERTFYDVSVTNSDSNIGCGRSQSRGRVEANGGPLNRISGGRTAQGNEFPWLVRIMGGCAGGLCGGTLITDRFVLTASHCVTDSDESDTKPCDHSDGQRIVILGQNQLTPEQLRRGNLYNISIIGVTAPPNAGLDPHDKHYEYHDFAMYILKKPARFSNKVQPICLPIQGTDYSGIPAVAAGWGRYMAEDKTTKLTSIMTKKQSPKLRRVDLIVSRHKFKHYKMFGTLVEKKDGEWQDPCAGDSGGPLMYQIPYRTPNDGISGRWVIIGTVHGAGFDCRTGLVLDFEGRTDGMWNKVSYYTDWIVEMIQKKSMEMTEGEKISPPFRKKIDIKIDPQTAFIPQWRLKQLKLKKLKKLKQLKSGAKSESKSAESA